jgi:hypothetical protein
MGTNGDLMGFKRDPIVNQITSWQKIVDNISR